jgi:hypothetical protein
VKRAVVNVLERAASTAIFSFTAAVPVGAYLDLSRATELKAAGFIAGGSAVQSVLKNVLAYFATQGNGPDVSSFDDGGKDA